MIGWETVGQPIRDVVKAIWSCQSWYGANPWTPPA